MSKFDLGFGSAIADKIIDEAEYNKLGPIDKAMEDAATKVKVATREMLLNFDNAIRERNDVIAAIKALPESEYKKDKIKEFKSVDSGGWFSPSFESRVNALQNVLKTMGLDHSVPEMQTLGLIPVAALAAVPTAAWVSGVAVVGIIGTLATYFATQGLRYAAIAVNPAGVAQADPSATTVIGTNISKGIQVSLIVAAIGGVAYYLMRKE